jgi:outer membrane receptor protein involved in Fe transport
MKKLLVLALIFSGLSLQAQSLSGLVSDGDNANEPLPFADVYLKGTTKGTTTDFDGNYALSLDSGEYTLVISFIGYESLEIPFTIADGEDKILNYTLSASQGVSLDEIEIVGTVSMERESALLVEQQKATVIKESIGSQRLAEIGVSNAATATTKISGVAKSEGSGDIYIRGLGDRYLSTTMNGLPIPSDNVNNKNINLSLFSTDVINNIGISKTYNTNSYADQASGNVDVTSKKYTRKGFSISASTGANTAAAGVDQFRQTIIMDDVNFFGRQSQQYAIRDAIVFQGWDPTTANNAINYDFSLSASYKFKLFGKDLGLVGSVSNSKSFEYREGIYRSYRANILNTSYPDTENRGTQINDAPDVEEFITYLNTTAYIRGDFKINEDHKIAYNTLYVSAGEDKLYEQGRNGLGYVFDQQPIETGSFVRDQNYKQTTLIVNQLMGDHQLGERNKLSWAGGYNYVVAKEPNRIRNEAIILDENNVTFADVSDFSQRKSEQRIQDVEYNAYALNEYQFGALDEDDQRAYKLNVGLNYRHKERNFNSQFIGVSTPGYTPGFANSGFLVPNVDDISSIYTAENFSNTANPKLTLKEQLPDLFNGELDIMAAFASVDFGLNKRFSGNIGARFERDVFNVDWDVKNYIGPDGPRRYAIEKEYTSLYPSVNLKYALTEKTFLRFASSMTQTLPEFKEFSPFQYEEPTGRVIQGNPDLEKSDVVNVDLKFEFFPKRGELLSATAFYKNIKDPINLSLTTGSSGFFEYNNTGDQATVFGLELEGRLNLLENEDGQGVVSANANVTLMSHNQDLLEKFEYYDIKETGLQGASDVIVNGSLVYNNRKENPFIGSLTANYASDKIYALGSPEDFVNSDVLFNHQIVEKGFVTMDMMLSKKFNKHITVKFTGRNLLNPNIDQTQEITRFDNSGTVVSDSNATVQSYKKGMNLSLGFTYSF